jgi:hypothetical protein
MVNIGPRVARVVRDRLGHHTIEPERVERGRRVCVFCLLFAKESIRKSAATYIDSMSSRRKALLDPSAQTPKVSLILLQNIKQCEQYSCFVVVFTIIVTHNIAGSDSSSLRSRSTRFDESHLGSVDILCLHSWAFSNLIQTHNTHVRSRYSKIHRNLATDTFYNLRKSGRSGWS